MQYNLNTDQILQGRAYRAYRAYRVYTGVLYSTVVFAPLLADADMQILA